MSKGVWQFKYVFGGLAEADQVDREATIAFSKNVNFRRKQDVITLNQRLSKDSGATIDGLPNWIRDLNGTVYSYVNNGKIYERMAASSWTLRKTNASHSGSGLGVDASYLYYSTASYVGRFPIGGTWGASENDTWQALTASSWNPIRYFANVNLLVIGNGNKLAVWDYAAANFSGSRLTMPSGWQIRDLEEWGDYLAISIWRGSSLRNSSFGKLVLWDGLSERPNAVVSSQAGNVQLTIQDKNYLNVFAGVIGNIYRFENSQLYQKRKIPFINEDAGENIEILPGSKTSWHGIPHFGVAGVATAASLSRGVYSFGSDRSNMPNALAMEYTISEDATDANVKIGAIHASSDNELYVGWQNNTTYGIDKLDTSNQYATGYVESLWNRGTPSEEGYMKVPEKFRILYEPLVSGQSLVVKIANDYNSSYATVANATVSGEYAKSLTQLADGNPFPSGRSHKIRIDFTSVGGAAPKLISMKTDYDVKETS